MTAWHRLSKDDNQQAYVGRFAPSPTGHLHLGSLLAAVASYCQARSQNGQWLIRMEDLDPPREVEGAAESIIQTLYAFGFEHDGTIIKQSQPERQQAYQTALQRLRNHGLIFACTCTRRQLRAHTIYPGTCRNRQQSPDQPHSLRIQVNDKEYTVRDKIQGLYSQNLATDCGDFNLLRKDGLMGYQLAVVVDDAYQGITEVVRGVDILDSTPRQLYLIELLGYAIPKYAHIPVIVGTDGHKLSKQTFAKEIHLQNPYPLIRLCLQLLGQRPPELDVKSSKAMLYWGCQNWNIQAVPKTHVIKNPILN
ncbi:tRNA glutamyl-Q(34) synthetase GluQRS [Marinicella sp. W31]|uniref:tRNA glutamyl-Q(34) synthetase GluQRS n=1 Tax=Marinicella sp. W31 TaxID=3023713 RepID=UPI00375829E5